MKKTFSAQLGVCELVIILGTCFQSVGLAEVVFDGSIGGSTGSVSGPNFQIPHTRGQIVGTNLFHSFSKFNLATGQSATFTGPASVANILARVTGGQSSINGTIQSNIQGANLFLMNPAGIVFGNGAKVNVTGAFHATTADYIELADGRRFSADVSGDVTLLSAPPEAFGFLAGSIQAGEIRVEGTGSTSVSGMNLAGSNIGLVGRKVELRNAYLKSAGGKVALIAAGEGEARVPLKSPPIEAPLDPSTSGDVIVTNSAISVSGDGSGEILMRGGKVTIDGAASGFILNGTQFDSFTGIDADAKGSGSAGDIRIESAGDILLGNGARLASFSRNDKSGGVVNLHAGGEVILTGASTVVASATSAGNGGLIRITASGLKIDGTGSSSATRLSAQSNSTATGAGGTIDLNLSGALEILNGGSIESNSLSTGGAGSISVHAESLHISGGQSTRLTGISSSNLSSGAGGSILIDVSGNTWIEDRGLIAAFNSGSATSSSLINVHSGSLDIIGLESSKGLGNDFLTGIVGQVTPGASGQGADIKVTVDGAIDLERGGLIDASVLSSRNSTTAGRGGNIQVSSGELLIDRMGSEYFTGIGSDTEFAGGAVGQIPTWNAGNISVQSGAITLRNGALISSSSGGTGNAGNVTVNARSLIAVGEGKKTEYVFSTASGIVAGTSELSNLDTTTRGNGGNVLVTASQSIYLANKGQIAAKADGLGNGGSVNVTVTNGGIAVDSGAAISARASQTGEAGQVIMYANQIDLTQGGRIESINSGTGLAGGITINTQHLSLTNSQIGVSAALNDAGKLQINASGDVIMTGGLVTADAGGKGNAGDVTVSAKSILISGYGYAKGSVVTARSGIVASTGQNSSGQGGNVTVRANGGALIIQNGGQIGAESLGSGRAGTVIVSAASTWITSDGILSSSATGGGNAGGIDLITGNLVVDHGEIGVRSTLADAGNIGIDSMGKITLTNALVTASAGGSGGNITLRAQEIIQIDHSAIVAEANRDGGNISIFDAPHLILNRSQISANAVNGTGGRILINTGTYFANESTVTASSDFGVQGVVRIDPLVSFAGGEETDEPTLLNPDDILQPDCVNRSPDRGSSFTKAGRGGTPRLPGGYQPSFRIIE